MLDSDERANSLEISGPGCAIADGGRATVTASGPISAKTRPLPSRRFWLAKFLRQSEDDGECAAHDTEAEDDSRQPGNFTAPLVGRSTFARLHKQKH